MTPAGPAAATPGSSTRSAPQPIDSSHESLLSGCRPFDELNDWVREQQQQQQQGTQSQHGGSSQQQGASQASGGGGRGGDKQLLQVNLVGRLRSAEHRVTLAGQPVMVLFLEDARKEATVSVMVTRKE